MHTLVTFIRTPSGHLDDMSLDPPSGHVQRHQGRPIAHHHPLYQVRGNKAAYMTLAQICWAYAAAPSQISNFGSENTRRLITQAIERLVPKIYREDVIRRDHLQRYQLPEDWQFENHICESLGKQLCSTSTASTAPSHYAWAN